AMVSVVSIYLLAGWLPGSAAWWIWGLSPAVGLLVGLEIPIVLRINEVLGLRLRLNAPLVMAPDYFGALAAFVLFTFLLLPFIYWHCSQLPYQLIVKHLSLIPMELAYLCCWL
ncbi:MAG: hypothetical protein IIC74_05985, partial [Bacteroidetes bacterium]|nr:hypothetical protein [Bacteroidota bacterium]